ncbi:MAG: hypothetical protein ABI760_04785 [Ferruginibacter sp.]
MENQNEIFEIDYEENCLKVEMINLPGQVLFRVSVPGFTPALVLCRASDSNHVKFWTSVPEGRQQQAEKIGPLIEKHFRSKMK